MTKAVFVLGFGASFLLSYSKDAKLEYRNPAGFIAVLLLAISSCAVYTYALPAGVIRHPETFPGVALAVVFFISYLAPARNRAREREGSADVVLQSSPVDPAAYYLGKVAAVWTAQAMAAICFVPVFHLMMEGRIVRLGLLLREVSCISAAGASLASLGVLLACTTDQNRLRESLLPLLLLPAGLPVFVFAADSMKSLGDIPDAKWLVLWILAAIYGATGALRYPRINA